MIPSEHQHLVALLGERFDQKDGRIAGVLLRALDVWEDGEDAADFLLTPHPLLGGDTPIDQARSEVGARKVEDILMKLDLGLPA
jgi:putative toxin-antitoxin system antitoxin component (TIGR02293 family)